MAQINYKSHISLQKQRKTLTPREWLLKKKHGSIHPESVSNYIPERHVTIPEPNNVEAYGTLTDSSTYSEYAWAFLRRNRFYQRLVDKALPNLTLDNWEYAPPINETPTGIVHLKHYSERFADGTPVEWWGIHTFRDGLQRPIPGPHRSQENALDWPRTQVEMIFDIGPLLGDNATAIDIQITMAKAHLYELARATGISFPEKRRSPDKKFLRAQLRVADLLSSPTSISRATESAELGKTYQTINADKPFDTLMLISEVAVNIPSYDLKKIPSGSNKNVITKIQKIRRASELAVGAWDNIYNMRFLQWLQFDNWDDLVPRSVQTATGSQDKSVKVTNEEESRIQSKV